jgi:hypothetical protein
VIGVAEQMAVEPVLPDDVTLRQVHDRGDFVRIAAMESEVWDDDLSWIAQDLQGRAQAAPHEIVVLVAEVDGQVISAAWLVFKPGTDFAGLWGAPQYGRGERAGSIGHWSPGAHASPAPAEFVTYRWTPPTTASPSCSSSASRRSRPPLPTFGPPAPQFDGPRRSRIPIDNRSHRHNDGVDPAAWDPCQMPIPLRTSGCQRSFVKTARNAAMSGQTQTAPSTPFAAE